MEHSQQREISQAHFKTSNEEVERVYNRKCFRDPQWLHIFQLTGFTSKEADTAVSGCWVLAKMCRVPCTTRDYYKVTAVSISEDHNSPTHTNSEALPPWFTLSVLFVAESLFLLTSVIAWKVFPSFHYAELHSANAVFVTIYSVPHV